MIDLKWQRVISSSIYLSRHGAQRPMAWRLSMLHYSNWPMSHLHEGPHWFLFTHALWKYTESGGVKYWYIKRRLTGHGQKPASGTSEWKKTSVVNVFVLFHRGFNWQSTEVDGKGSPSCSGTPQRDGRLPTQGTEPRSSSWRDSLRSHWATTLQQYLLFTVFTINSSWACQNIVVKKHFYISYLAFIRRSCRLSYL